MPYITSVEKIGMEKEAVRFLSRQMARRFKVDPDAVPPMLFGLSTEEIEELGERFLEAGSLDGIRKWAEEKRQSQSRQ